ncbi:ABC transporter integral membrane subunit [human gut metagenome]|uniref:ABC transporter integral membrane subunit n=1 Tax=human gut metagenome TaxID=408170 RepID=K1SIP2_9ZZZZ
MTLVRKDKTGGFLEVRHYKDLLIQLVSRDLKLKYRRSFLGYVWSVLNPLLIMIVMYVVFSKLFDRNIPNFPVYLLVGRTLYDFIVGATNKAMDGITSNAALLKKPMFQNICSLSQR